MNGFKERIKDSINAPVAFDTDRLGKRRVLGIFIEWLLFSFLWNMFYFQYLKNSIKGFSELFSLPAYTVIITLVIVLGLDIWAEFILFAISKALVNFILIGDYHVPKRPDGDK